REFPKAQRTDLKHFYNKLINLSRKYTKDSVIKYGIKISKRIKIDKSNWELYESLTYSLALADGAILTYVLQILLQNKSLVNKNNLKSTICSLLNQNIYKGHNYEVAWSLWIAKTFEISIERNIAQQIVD